MNIGAKRRACYAIMGGVNNDSGRIFDAERIEQHFDDVLASMEELERKIICERFGLDDGRAQTLEELEEKFSMSKSEIRQIEAWFIRHVASFHQKQEIKDFLD